MVLVDGLIVLAIIFFLLLPITDAKTVRMKLSVLSSLGVLWRCWLWCLTCRTDEVAGPVNVQPPASVGSGGWFVREQGAR